MKRYLLALLGGLFLCSQVLAADSTVSGMSAASALDGTELYYCVQGGADRKCTGAQVKTFANTSAVRATTTTSEALANSDQGKLVTFSNASAVACTIAQAGSGGNFAAGWVASLKNLGAGTVTCTPATSTVDGAATVTLTTGQGIDLYSDGTNYFTQPGKGASGANPTATASDTAVNGSAATFMRSDAAPAIQKASSSQFGVVEVDNTSIAATGGVIGVKALTGGCTTTAGAVATTCLITHPGYKAGNYYVPSNFWGTTGTGSAGGSGIIYLIPFYMPQKATLSELAFNLITPQAASNCQLAIYNSNPSDPTRAGTLVGATGSIATTAAGNKNAVFSGSATFQLNIGWYWFGMNCDTSGIQTSTIPTNGLGGLNSIAGSATLANVIGAGGNSQNMTLRVTQSFGTWPDLTGATYTESAANPTVPLPVFKVTSVP